jgi:hypothetical protein
MCLTGICRYFYATEDEETISKNSGKMVFSLQHSDTTGNYPSFARTPVMANL